tara:strand:+ start:143 stop:784 length:642 start_codon:yes stop_codon:yes gene_type:complete
MLEHFLLPLTFIIIFYYPIISILIFLSTIFIKKDKENIKNIPFKEWIANNKTKWLAEESEGDIYEYLDNCDLYKIIEYVEKRKQFWKKGQFKNEKNGMDQHIKNQISNIKNKYSDYLTDIIVSYIYIAKKGIKNKILDIEIMENMHSSYQNIMLNYKIINTKNIRNFKEISVKKKYIYQLYLSSVFEDVYDINTNFKILPDKDINSDYSYNSE